MTEENKNIFEGAKFGDKFITRDGRVAIFNNTTLRHGCTVSYFLLEDIGITAYEYDFNTCIDFEENYDIVSRYQEEIDEESLNDIVSEYAINADVEAYSMIVNQGMSESTARFNVVCKAYIAGYRQRAQEE